MAGMPEEEAGGCRCGAVRYRLTRRPICVNGCHCRDCQKLGGGAFAINLMVEAAAVETTAGAVAPDAFGMARCPLCGTALWGTHPLFGAAIRFVRAGTLDHAERFAPDAHFFVRSKHPWIALPPGVPAFDTLPGPGDGLFDAAQQARVEAALAG